jgi:hypothetical protein
MLIFVIKLKELVMKKGIEEEGDDRRIHHHM